MLKKDGRSGNASKKSQEFQIKILWANPGLKHPPARLLTGGPQGRNSLVDPAMQAEGPAA
jgi:hypothetical protein